MIHQAEKDLDYWARCVSDLELENRTLKANLKDIEKILAQKTSENMDVKIGEKITVYKIVTYNSYTIKDRTGPPVTCSIEKLQGVEANILGINVVVMHYPGVNNALHIIYEKDIDKGMVGYSDTHIEYNTSLFTDKKLAERLAKDYAKVSNELKLKYIKDDRETLACELETLDEVINNQESFIEDSNG